MHLSPEECLFHTNTPNAIRRALLSAAGIAILTNLLPLSLTYQVSILLFGLAAVAIAIRITPKDWKLILLSLLPVTLALSIGLIASNYWSQGSEKQRLTSLFTRTLAGTFWISTLTLSISWKDFTDSLDSLGVPRWLINFIDEAVASALLLLRGLTETQDSVRQRLGSYDFSSTPRIVASRLDHSFSRIRASIETRSLRMAIPIEINHTESNALMNYKPETTALNVKIIELNDPTTGHGILKNIDFELKAGDWLGVFGASGSGKTTLFRAISGLTPISNGTIQFFEKEKTNGTPHADVGLVFQNPEHSVIGATAWDDVCIGPQFRKIPRLEAEERACRLFNAFDLQHLKDRPVSRLSFGELKRLSLISTLANRPKILLCDEPTSGLDPISANRLIQALSDVADKEGISVLWASHDLHLLPNRIRRGIVLSQGELTRTIQLKSNQELNAIWPETGLWPMDHSMHAVTFPETKRYF